MAIAPFLFILIGVNCEFNMVPGLYFYCPLRRKRCTFLPESTDVRIQQYIHQKVSTFVYHYINIPRLLLNWRKFKQRTELRRDAYNQSKKYLEILICFWFQWMSQSNLFVIKVWQFLVLYLTCSYMNFNFTEKMTLSHLLLVHE